MTELFVQFVVGWIVAFTLWWAPGIAPLWEKIPVKRVTLLVLFVLVPVLFTIISCYLPVESKVLVVCSTETGWFGILTNVGNAMLLGIAALAGSQGGYVVLLKWFQDLKHPALD